MWISKQTLIEYAKEHSLSISGLFLYSLGLEGGWVFRWSHISESYCFVMGDYIDVDWKFFTEKVLDREFFDLLERLYKSFGDKFLIYGIEDKVYICVRCDAEGIIYERLKGLYIKAWESEDDYLVNYDGVVYYKYLIGDIDTFLGVLDLLGV